MKSHGFALLLAFFLFLLIFSSCKGGSNTTPGLNGGVASPPDVSIAYGFKADGKTVRFPKGATISVYVQDGSSVSGYQPGHRGAAEKYALRWNSIGSKYGLFNIVITDSPDSAAINLRWTESLGGNLAGQTTFRSHGASLLLPIDIVIATNVNGLVASSSQISITALHEVGHALGLWQHSSNPNDVMYPMAINGAFSKADIATLYLCYTTFADIIAGGRGVSTSKEVRTYTIERADNIGLAYN